jgi:hypothetical protein
MLRAEGFLIGSDNLFKQRQGVFVQVLRLKAVG